MDGFRRRRCPVFRGALLLFVFLTACGGGEERGPDIALIVIDTLRRDHLESYGYDRPTAPWITALAERAVVFENAYSTSSWTAPATATLFTGLYPTRHGVVLGMHAAIGERRRAGDEHPTMSLSRLPEVATLPELLQNAGYQTFAVAANVNVAAERGFDRGFDRFEAKVEGTAEELAEVIKGWRRARRRGRPAFWYLHFDDVHRPYHSREPWYEPQYDPVDENVSRYNSEIRYLDGQLEQIAKTLRWDDDTVVVVVSDHGEEFTDHGDFGHKHKLYAELVNVPVIVSGPELFGPARRIDSPVSLIDVLPTLAELAGVATPDRDGTSWMSLLRTDQGDAFPERPLYVHRRATVDESSLWAVVSDGWKLIYDDATDSFELYSLREDPTDQVNLANERPEIVEPLAERLELFRATQALEAGRTEIALDPELHERLEVLGYGAADDDE